MDLNAYKSAMYSVKTDESKYKGLCSMVDSVENSFGSVPENRGKKIRFPVVLAAALIIAALGVTTIAAANGGNLFGLKNHFDRQKEIWNISEEIPQIDNLEAYATAVNINAETDVKEILPKLTVASGDGHRVVAVIEVDIKDLNLPNDIPEDAVLEFGHAEDNTNAKHRPKLISRDGTVYTYSYTTYPIASLPDELVIELHDYGYYTGEGYIIDNFVTILGGTFKLTVDADKLNTVEEFVKKSEPMEVKGAMIELELTPMGLSVYGSRSQWHELGLFGEEFFCRRDALEFYTRDGRVLGDSDGNYFETELYALICSATGWTDWENDIVCNYYGFDVPIDVDEIEAVSLFDVRFDFKHTE